MKSPDKKKGVVISPLAAAWDRADMGLGGRVALAVPGKGLGVGEDLATTVDDTDKVGGVGMAPEVLVEDVHAREFLGAAGNRARVGLLPGVGAHVHDELHLGGEGLADPRAIGPQTGGREGVRARVAVDVVVQDVLPQHRHMVEAVLAAGPVARVLLLGLRV